MKGIVIFALAIQSCVSTAAAGSSADITGIQGKDWILAEIRTGPDIVRINRTAGANEVYTLRFEADRIGGVAFPNRYFAPYTSGEANALTIGMAGSTMMASLFERDDLKENEYFAYLQKVFCWELKNGTLELHSFNVNNVEVILVFSD